MTEPYYNPADVLAAANRLDESMVGLKDEIRYLRKYGRRNRHLIWGLAASIVFDVALSVLLFFVFVVAGNARDSADRNRQTQIATCESGNQARQVSSNLWSYVLDQAAKNPENQTEARRRQIADFRAYMLNAYATRDCSQIGK
jgi:hypothetical protein